jgi:hypothetical protein
MMRDLVKEVRGMPVNLPDNRFVLWFLSAYSGDDPFSDAMKKSITGGKGDGGIDAVLINHDSRRVVLIQGKYASNLGKKALWDLSGVAKNLRVKAYDNDIDGSEHKDADYWWEHLRSDVRVRLQKILAHIRDGYELRLVVATTARVPLSVVEDWKRHARENESREVFDRQDILRLFQDYLSRVPYVGEVPLRCKSDYFRTEDNGIESYLLPVPAKELATIYHREGDKLFARNVRAFLGPNKAINKAMKETLRSQPKEFWFRNNGVTMVCDKARVTQVSGNGT